LRAPGMLENITAVVLAAGFSSRMGTLKPLLPLCGVPAVAYLAGHVRAAGVEDILVVTGHESEKVEEALAAMAKEGRVRFCYNGLYASGMFSSVVRGLKDVRGDAALVFPADVPLVKPETIGALADFWARGEAPAGTFALPACGGKRGHPLLIPRGYFPEIFAHDGEGGLRAVLDRHAEQTQVLEVPDAGVLLEMDTPEDYEVIRRKAAENIV